MAASEYAVVSNIPSNFHAADLRAHFSSLVERKAFNCFHFRHRPEKVDTNKSVKPKPEDVKRCCVVKISGTELPQLLTYNDEHWTDVKGEVMTERCQITPVKLKSILAEENTQAIEEEKLLQMPELRPPELMPNGNVGTPTLVFLDFIQKCLLPHNLVNKLQLKFPKTSAKRLYGNVDFDYGKSGLGNRGAKNSHYLPTPSSSAKSLSHHRQTSERGKDSVPNSFSNTTEPHSSNITSEKSVELQCHKTIHAHSNSQMLLGDCNKVESGSEKHSVFTESESQLLSLAKDRTDTDSIPSNGVDSTQNSLQRPHQGKPETVTNAPLESGTDTVQKTHILSSRERKRKEKEERRETRKLMDEGIEERLIAIEKKYHNDDDAEEWDRHEASEDDPSNQERNKERLYEEEIEQPWEKGGPGVVFYTDAMYWQEKEGDFDEQTTDDLDVDFSVYEEPGTGAGDKDIKDFLKIRQEQRFRSGYDKTDRFSIGIGKKLPPSGRASETKIPGGTKINKIGAFERYSKGIGRKVMEKQGWKEGQGLGSSRPGIVDALRGEGQRPHNKRGLGYVEEAPVLYGPPKVKRREEQSHLITTVYDNPEKVDPKEPLLQRSEPTVLKHRQSHIDSFTTS